jgi:GT2 family glycosyltransferase
LLNNDTIVTPKWLSRFEALFAASPKFGALGPVSNTVVGPQCVQNPDYFDRESLENYSESRFRAFGNEVIPVNRIIGFCLAMRANLLKKLGGLDENFGRGNFEDDDYCARIRHAGFSIGMTPGIFIHHSGNQTFRSISVDYKQLLDRNLAYFERKWNLPHVENGYVHFDIDPKSPLNVVPLPDLSKNYRTELQGKIFIET